jgi:hypothetical protein
MASATCANGLLLLQAGGEGGDTPEPATAWLIGLGMFGLLCRHLNAKRRSAAGD